MSRRMRRDLAIGLLAAAIALSASACGSDDDEGGSAGGADTTTEAENSETKAAGGKKDKAAVVEAIEESTTSADSETCTRVQTQAFNEQRTGKTGDSALLECAEAASNPYAEAVKVSDVRIDGDSATAEFVATSGSFFNHQVVGVELVLEGGDWKLDAFTGYPDGFDVDAFVTNLGEVPLARDWPAEAAPCLREHLGELSEDQIADMFQSRNEELRREFVQPCIGDPHTHEGEAAH